MSHPDHHSGSRSGATLRGVRRSYRSTTVLDGLDLDLRPGVTGLLGPNGAGKTTLLRIMATVLSADAGRIDLLGRDPSIESERVEIRRRLGYVPQEAGYHEDFSAFEFVDYLAILKEMVDRSARHDEVNRVLDLVGLADVRHRKLRKLSGGMRRRVVIAQALLGRPELLVLDEPTVGLDPEQRLRFREMLSAVGPDATVVLSTHQTTDISALCQRVVVLDAGRITFDGTPTELTATADGRVWHADDRHPDAAVAWVAGNGRVRNVGAAPAGADLAEPTIEDAYLLMIGADRALADANERGHAVSSTIAFVVVVAGFLALGTLYRQWDRAHQLRFTDEAGSTTATRAVARFEARQIVTHPVWLALAAFVTIVTTLLLLGDDSGTVEPLAPAVPFALVGIAAAGLGLIVTTHRVGTRARRDHTEELEASTPTAPSTRTSGLLLACLAPIPGLIVLIALAIGVSRYAYGLTPPPSISNLAPMLALLAIGVGGALVGVLTSRWLPLAIGPVVAIAGVLFLNNGPGHLHPRERWLRASVEVDYAGRFDIRPTLAHGLMLVGVLALAACLALLAHGWRRPTVAAAIVSVSLVAGAGWVATRAPSDEDISAVAAELEEPTRHQHCERSGPVRYCVYPGSEEWIDEWTPAVASVLAQVPTRARPTALEVVQRPWVDPRGLLSEVREAIDPSVVWAADGRLHPGMNLERADVPDLSVAWQAAAAAVGLPPATDLSHPAGCLAGGQSRIVLAHLLAARATSTTRTGVDEVVGDVDGEGRHLTAVSMDLEGDYDADTAQGEGAEVRHGDRLTADGRTPRSSIAILGASGWGSDVLAATALADADRHVVDDVIDRHWDELVDPATPTSRFLELAGLDAPTPSGPLTTADDPNACA